MAKKTRKKQYRQNCAIRYANKKILTDWVIWKIYGF